MKMSGEGWSRWAAVQSRERMNDGRDLEHYHDGYAGWLP